MPKAQKTTMSVSGEVKAALRKLEQYPDESFDNILRRVLGLNKPAPQPTVPPAGEGAEA